MRPRSCRSSSWNVACAARPSAPRPPNADARGRPPLPTAHGTPPPTDRASACWPELGREGLGRAARPRPSSKVGRVRPSPTPSGPPPLQSAGARLTRSSASTRLDSPDDQSYACRRAPTAATMGSRGMQGNTSPGCLYATPFNHLDDMYLSTDPRIPCLPSEWMGRCGWDLLACLKLHCLARQAIQSLNGLLEPLHVRVAAGKKENNKHKITGSEMRAYCGPAGRT